MKEENKLYEKYPGWIAIVYNLVMVLKILIGALIFIRFSKIIAVLYILYCTSVNIRVILYRCPYCCYYGKTCGAGLGKVAPYFLKKKDYKIKFSNFDLLLIILTVIFPVTGAIILLIIKFSWLVVILLGLFVFVFFIQSKIALKFVCDHCKQREISCDNLFFPPKINQ